MKMVSLCVHACFLFIIILLPFVKSSDQDQSFTAEKDNNKAQLSHKLLVEITTHGVLLWTSMGFFMPIGILSIRMLNGEDRERRRTIIFQIHVISQTLAVLISTAGAVLSFKNFNNTFYNNHQRIGVVLYCLIWLQVLIGFFRPPRGAKVRGFWFFVHWMIGTAMSLMGVYSIYSGLQAYHEKTSRNISLWTSLFTAQLCFICFFYLFQDKWNYIRNQDLVSGGKSSTISSFCTLAPPKQDQKLQLAVEPC